MFFPCSAKRKASDKDLPVQCVIINNLHNVAEMVDKILRGLEYYSKSFDALPSDISSNLVAKAESRRILQ